MNKAGRNDRILELPTSRLALFCGWPLSGKTTLAHAVAELLALYHLDIDTGIRVPVFGAPKWIPGEYEEFRVKDGLELGASYALLMHAIEHYLQMGRSAIVSATLSKTKTQIELQNFRVKYPATAIRIIWCRPLNDTVEEVRRRLASRADSAERGDKPWEKRYIDPTSSLSRYNEVKNRFDPICIPHIAIDTSPPRTVEECAADAIQYILS